MLGLALALSCQSPTEREKQLLAGDTQTLAQLDQINTELNAAHRITPANFEILKNLHAKYPNSPAIGSSYKTALVYRDDWEALAKLLGETPTSARPRNDSILLSKVYMKLGRFAESSQVLQGIGAAASNDVDTRSLSAMAHFNQGHVTDAAADLDAVWDAIIREKRLDDINLRGLVYFRLKDYPRAIETLRRSNELAPLNPVTTNTLSRVYAAAGDAAKAEQYRKETERAQNQLTAEEVRKLQFVSLGRKLEAAWSARQYDKVLSIAKEMLPISDENNKVALRKYVDSAEAGLKKQNTR
jgi:tetratricopeptide (TPR) repeat protein